MVLSNKKLKQKLRSVLAESLAKSETQANEANVNDPQSHQSFKSLLNSVTLKPKLSKREIRRVKIPSQDQENGVEEKQIEVVDGGLEKNNKRKREKNVTKEKKDLGEKKINKKKKKKQVKIKKVVKKEEESVLEEQDVTTQVIQPQPQPQPSKEDESICTKVYVGGIPYYSTVDDIQSFFEGCGSIIEIDCLKFPETGKFNGIAMISFRTEAAAKRALALDGSDMGGLSLKIQPYKATRDKKVSDFAPAMLEGYNKIYVGNLSWDMTEDELKNFFSDGSISSIRLGKDKETGEFKGFAHVNFADSLSLTMALKLDQKPLFGRPVRIRCAVPPKSVSSKDEGNVKFVQVSATIDRVVDDDVARNAKRQNCYDCGEKGHLSSSCPNKKVADVAHTSNKASDMVLDEVEADNIGDSKVKRRTCYECGEKGHLSSSCPNKKVVDVAHKGDRIDDVVLVEYEKEADYVGQGKLKRRTCYECGEKGHLSSSCQKKQDADGANSRPETFSSVVVKDNEEVEFNMVSSVSDGKLRRRSCYECGERGHLSSACPKNQATDVTNSIKHASDMEVEKADVGVAGKEVSDNNVVCSISEGKLRRRTCYECGERGHLSSLCPKKQTADVASLSKEVEEVETMGAVSDGKLRRRICYECGLKGHVSSLCPNKKKTDLTA